MSTIVEHPRHITDLETALSVTLERKNEAGILVALNLTSYTVKFKMIDQNNNVTIAETEVGISYDNRSAGEVSYLFLSAGVLTEGVYYGYFIAYDASSKSSHFPVVKKELKITLYGD